MKREKYKRELAQSYEMQINSHDSKKYLERL